MKFNFRHLSGEVRVIPSNTSDAYENRSISRKIRDVVNHFWRDYQKLETGYFHTDYMSNYEVTDRVKFYKDVRYVNRRKYV